MAFSYNDDYTEYADKVAIEVNRQKGIICKYAGNKSVDSLQSQMIAVALRNKDDSYQDVAPYIKTLAQNMPKISDDNVTENTIDDEGEVSYVFTSLQHNAYAGIEVGVDSCIISCLNEMYLIDKEYTKSLKKLLFGAEELTDLKQFRPKSERMNYLLQKLLSYSYYSGYYDTITQYFLRLESKRGKAKQTKTIRITKGNYALCDMLPEMPVLCTGEGKPYVINKFTLLSEPALGFHKCRSYQQKKLTIQKINISEYYDYVYNRVFVEQGVDNSVITWAVDDNYMLTSPGGEQFMNEDRDTFVEYCYKELFLNLLDNNISIIGASIDEIYIKMRGAGLSAVLCETVYGKTFNLRVTTEEV